VVALGQENFVSQKYTKVEKKTNTKLGNSQPPKNNVAVINEKKNKCKYSPK
jgi:hypothetical protein